MGSVLWRLCPFSCALLPAPCPLYSSPRMAVKRRAERRNETPSEPAPPAEPRRWVAPLLVVLATAGSGYAFFNVISRFSVNILYYDQWDYYGPLFAGRSIWSMFPVQHGPIRQGLGGVLLGIVARASSWSSRADAFAVGIAIALALAAAFAVKRRLGNRLTAADAVLPLLFFNLAQVESLIVVPNPAHGAVPLLLAMLYVLAWTIENRRVASCRWRSSSAAGASSRRSTASSFPIPVRSNTSGSSP
jgi:hypothetical protein